MQLAPNELLAPEASSALKASGASLRTPNELAEIVTRFARSEGWIDRVRLRTDKRWYERLHHGPDYDIWVISWMPGQSTGFHDHGESSGAFVVATGMLEEHRLSEQALEIRPGDLRTFGFDYAHDVRNVSFAPAVSIHAYSPPLDEMNEYELDEGRLVPRERVSESASVHDQPSRKSESSDRMRALNIEQVLSNARARLERLSAREAQEAVTKEKAILVDIRPAGQRAVEGSIPGALIVERNVLEWRFDPASDSRLSIVTDYDLQVILFCSEGYTSSLAAAALQDLGLWRATDVIGGYRAWREMGLCDDRLRS